MSDHKLSLDPNCELGLQAELLRRNQLNGTDLTADDLIATEIGALCRGFYAQSVQAEAQAVTEAFLNADPEQQAAFRERVVPIAVEVLKMEVAS